MNKEKTYWSTGEEMRVIDSLGRFTTNDGSVQTNLHTRKEALEGYLKACDKRDNWNGMNRDVVVSYAQGELERV